MSEATLVTKLIKYLRDDGFWAVKIHGGPNQQAGIPDILAVKFGRAFFFEAKVPGGKATKLQVAVMADLSNVGAVVGVVHSLDEMKDLIFAHLSRLSGPRRDRISEMVDEGE